MKLTDAYKELGLSPSATDEEIKAKYRSLAKEFHPDLNPANAERFKQINASHQAILEARANPKPQNPFRRVHESADQEPFINFSDFFTQFTHSNQTHVNKTRQAPTISLKLQISFRESILGVSKDLQFPRQIKCESCQGTGQIKKGNGCQKCDGFGRITSTRQHISYTMSCNACYGRDIKVEKCTECQTGVKETNHTFNVQVPAGITTNTILRMQGAGHFVQTHPLFGDSYNDVHLQVEVIPDPILSLANQDVICPLSLTLLEALAGCEKSVPTIEGEQKIQVPPNSRHKEEVILKGLGVKGTAGVQRVQFTVNYPDNLLTLLKGDAHDLPSKLHQ